LQANSLSTMGLPVPAALPMFWFPRGSDIRKKAAL
jgi:hypothetical protein